MTLVAALAQLPDVEPHVISFVPGLRRPERRIVDGTPIVYLPRIRRLSSLTLHILERRSLARELRSLDADLVHAHDSTRYGYICLKAVRGAPVVVVVHGISREERKFERSVLAHLRFSIAGTNLERYCVRHARWLMQPTRYPEEYFGDEIRGRIWDVALPIADRFFVASEPVAGRILCAGAVIRRKRLLDLVEALPAIASVVPETHLCVAGGEEYSEYAQEVRARVRQLGLESRVEFRGPLSPEELVDEYRRASVFVLPSGQETSPMAISEAMAAGVPVVATRVGGVPSLVEEGRTGSIVEPGDVAALAERVVEVLGDRERASALGAAARQRAERSSRVSAVASRVRDVYVEVLREYAAHDSRR